MSLALHLISLAGWLLLVFWLIRVGNRLPYDLHFITAILLITVSDVVRLELL